MTRKIARRLLFAAWCALVALAGMAAPTTAFASTPITTATVDADGTLKIESYLQNVDTENTVVRPTDYIFVLDQSRWMNGTDGDQREAIIESLSDFVGNLDTPTYGENRVAIAGYGRINVGTNYDSYDAAEFPGVNPNSTNVSFNTGYYTTAGFKSVKGWTEVSDITGDALPTMPTSQFAGASYDSCFLTTSSAQTVLDPTTMNAWYAGASRMDAGLALAERLAEMANAADTGDERDLVVIFVSSSLPILHKANSDLTYVRSEAVTHSSQVLKDMGATIFALTNYVPSGRVITAGQADTEENFDAVMDGLCSASTYYFPVKATGSLARILTDLVTEVSIVSAGEAAQSATIAATTFDTQYGTTTWTEFAGDKQDAYLRSSVSVKVYDFTGYDSSGTPRFKSTPRLSYKVSLASILADDGISYKTEMIPVPSAYEYAEQGAKYGSKVVLTVTQPLTVDFQWAGDAVPSGVALPGDEILLQGEEIYAPSPETDDEHYEFLGWYLDKDCTIELSGDAVAYKDMTLYGKWEKVVVVNFYWNIWNDDYDYPDSVDTLAPGGEPSLFDPDEMNGMVFDGWYLDKDCTKPYVPGPVTSDLDLYAKWVDPNAEDEPGVDDPADDEPDVPAATDPDAADPAEKDDAPATVDKPAATVVPVNVAQTLPDTGVEALGALPAALAGAAALAAAVRVRRR